ncbi:Alanine racemase [bioreactor metagenome]|uniref:Alanine racemase n=1 Tax=bioreactor metagenome TaxID=1076179 RepID=A0A644ZGB6_9ZZZZ
MNSVCFPVDDIISICRANCIVRAGKATEIHEIVTDSRHIADGSEILFVALRGVRHDGHQFLQEAYDKGVRTFLVADIPEFLQSKTNCTILQTADTLSSLQLLAAAHRKKFNIPVLAITGSNGKTMVKEWLYQLLSPDADIVRSPKSYNSQVGVPLSVFNLAENHTMAIFEAGISQPGEMQNLEKIIQPTAGIFTNIGTAHDENFIDHRQKAAEKLQLFVNCKKIIYCSDDAEIEQKIISSGLNKKLELFSWGHKQDAWLQVVQSTAELNGTIVTAKKDEEILEIFIPFSDAGSVENIMQCWVFMLSEGIDQNTIAGRIRRLSSIEMRLELKEGKNHCTIINDSYNSDINSLSIAIDFLEKNRQYKQKTIILSDILQSGRNAGELANEIAQLISKRGIDRFIGIGKDLFDHKNVFSGDASFYLNTEEFLRDFDLSSFRDEMILLKGARRFGFERISALIEDKAHETILETDLNALTHNINFFRSKLSPGTRMMAMVKAFAYGSGAVEIARHLEYHRFDYLAVAYADEGVALRNAGITMPIMVMSPEENNFYFLFRHQLEPEIYSFGTLEKLIENIGQYSSFISLPVKIHIKFDSGMHRLGFTSDDAEKLFTLLKKHNQEIRVASVFSHFTSSDEAAENDFTMKQLGCLTGFAGMLEETIGYKVIRHIANSAAILRYPQTHLDMVRLGIGMYGVDPSETNSKELMTVVSLKTKILQIKNLAAGETVGYSRKAKSDKARTTATLAIGYADGFHRNMGNGKWKVSIHGKLVPVIGNICMDMCIADITGIPDVHEGDEVEIFGSARSVSRYADAMGTIPYEALTSVSARVKRIYIQKD